jgi:hypothetical protein
MVLDFSESPFATSEYVPCLPGMSVKTRHQPPSPVRDGGSDARVSFNTTVKPNSQNLVRLWTGHSSLVRNIAVVGHTMSRSLTTSCLHLTVSHV